MASPLDLPASSGAITGSGAAGSVVNLVGFSVRAGASDVSINIREVGASGHIIIPLYVAANTCVGDVFPRTVSCKGPLYCEFVTGAAAGLGNVLVG